MSDRQYSFMFMRLGALALVIFGIFWGIWHLTGRQVPNSMTLWLVKDILLTFHVSRWTDIILAFVAVNFYAWAFRYYYKFAAFSSDFVNNPKNKNDIHFCLWFGLALGFVFNIAIVMGLLMLRENPTIGIISMSSIVSSFLSVLLASGFSWFRNFDVGHVAGWSVGLAFNFVTNLVFSFFVGIYAGFLVFIPSMLITLLVAVFSAALVTGFKKLLKTIFSGGFWHSIYKWFIAEDIA